MKKGLNLWQVMGNVGREPEMRNTQAGVSVCNFSIAVNSSWKNPKEEIVEHVEWINVVCWRKLAEIAVEYVKKGAPVYVSGKAQTTSYEDKEGIKRYKTELVADNLVLLGRREGEPSTGYTAEEAPPARAVDPDLPF